MVSGEAESDSLTRREFIKECLEIHTCGRRKKEQGRGKGGPSFREDPGQPHVSYGKLVS